MAILRPKTKDEIRQELYPIDLDKSTKAVSANHLEFVKEIVHHDFPNGHKKKNILNEMILTAAQEGKYEIFKYLAENGADMHCSYNSCFLMVCEFNHLNILKYMLENCEIEKLQKDKSLDDFLNYNIITPVSREVNDLVQNYIAKHEQYT